MLVGTPRARKEAGKGRKKKEGENGGNKGAPSYDTGRAPSYDESILGHPRKKGRGRKEERKGQVFPATNKRPGTHQ